MDHFSCEIIESDFRKIFGMVTIRYLSMNIPALIVVYYFKFYQHASDGIPSEMSGMRLMMNFNVLMMSTFANISCDIDDDYKNFLRIEAHCNGFHCSFL